MPMLPTWPGQPMPMKQMTMGFFMRSLTQLVFRYEQSIQPTESEQGVSGLVMSKPASACEADGWAKVADPRQKICALTRTHQTCACMSSHTEPTKVVFFRARSPTYT